jgi:hypothetical protein
MGLVVFLIEASAYQWDDENANAELSQAISWYKSWYFDMTDNPKDYRIPRWVSITDHSSWNIRK